MAAAFRVTAAHLNLRAAPGASEALVSVLDAGDVLTSAGAEPVPVEGSVWINVRTGLGVVGWVNSRFVSALATFSVTAAHLNLRAQPDPESEILSVLSQGDTLTEAGAAPVTLPDGNRWLQVTTADGVVGFVNERFLRKDDGAVPGGNEVLAWGAKVDAAFRTRVRSIATDHGFDPDFLMAAMAFETGRAFQPDTRNPVSNATGLIQFLPSTARSLGTTVEALAQMTAVGQLDFVEAYLAPFKGRLRTIEDVYMSILFPVAIGQPNEFVLFRKGTPAYEQNAGLDSDRNGEVTKREAASRVVAMLDEGRQPANCA